MNLTKIIMVFTVLVSLTGYAQNNITSDDVKSIVGPCTGTLTYIDYSLNKAYTMPAKLTVNLGSNETFNIIIAILMNRRQIARIKLIFQKGVKN